jgi:protein transport protein SEC24
VTIRTLPSFVTGDSHFSPLSGLRVTKYFGNFLQRNPIDIEFGILDADKAITVELDHTGKLDPRSHGHLQCAVLYTTVDGERRVRVINLALSVVELAGNVFQYADMETTLAYFTREGMHCNLSALCQPW